jgi:hypothetical protein
VLLFFVLLLIFKSYRQKLGDFPTLRELNTKKIKKCKTLLFSFVSIVLIFSLVTIIIKHVSLPQFAAATVFLMAMFSFLAAGFFMFGLLLIRWPIIYLAVSLSFVTLTMMNLDTITREILGWVEYTGFYLFGALVGWAIVLFLSSQLETTKSDIMKGTRKVTQSYREFEDKGKFYKLIEIRKRAMSEINGLEKKEIKESRVRWLQKEPTLLKNAPMSPAWWPRTFLKILPAAIIISIVLCVADVVKEYNTPLLFSLLILLECCFMAILYLELRGALRSHPAKTLYRMLSEIVLSAFTLCYGITILLFPSVSQLIYSLFLFFSALQSFFVLFEYAGVKRESLDKYAKISFNLYFGLASFFLGSSGIFSSNIVLETRSLLTYLMILMLALSLVAFAISIFQLMLSLMHIRRCRP